MDSGICLFVKKIFLYRILVKCGKEREIYDPDDSRGFKKALEQSIKIVLRLL